MADTIYLNDGERVIVFDDESLLKVVEEKLGTDFRLHFDKLLKDRELNYDKAYDEGYEEGYDKGYEDGKEEYEEED